MPTRHTLRQPIKDEGLLRFRRYRARHVLGCDEPRYRRASTSHLLWPSYEMLSKNFTLTAWQFRGVPLGL